MSKNPKVAGRVDELVSASATKAGVTIDRVVQELAKIAFSDNPQGAGLGHNAPDEHGKARNGAERKLVCMPFETWQALGARQQAVLDAIEAG